MSKHRGRRLRHGHFIIQNGGTVRRYPVGSTGGSIGLSAGSIGTVTVTGPGSTWINGPSGGLNIGSFGTGTLTIANGGRVIDITPLVTNVGNGAGSQGTVRVTGAGSFGATLRGLGLATRAPARSRLRRAALLPRLLL